MLGEVALMPQGVVLSRCENKLSVSQDDRAQRSGSRLVAFGGRDVGFGCGRLVAGTQDLGVY